MTRKEQIRNAYKLTGGHSGAEIHKPLLNANTVLLRLMQAAGVPFALVALAGGVRDNVIPTEAFAELLVQPDDIPALRQKQDCCSPLG